LIKENKEQKLKRKNNEKKHAKTLISAKNGS
jgi:hypothetical protein